MEISDKLLPSCHLQKKKTPKKLLVLTTNLAIKDKEEKTIKVFVYSKISDNNHVSLQLNARGEALRDHPRKR